MKKTIAILFLALTCCLAACNDDQAVENGYIETTQEGAETLVLKGYESYASGFSVFQPDGFSSPFYIREKAFYGNAYKFVSTDASRLDAMQAVPVNADWQLSAEVKAGRAYWARYAAARQYHFVKFRVIAVEANDVTLEYVISSEVEERPDENANANAGYENVSVTGYEIPRLDDNAVYADHYVTVGNTSIVNYALEWNADKKHANWVAFSFNATTCADKVSRTDAWNVDPALPESMRVDNTYHTNDGFDRGHLCASEDRVYTKEANEQTFYFSNMSPQLNGLNAGLWQKLEARVQAWGRSCTSSTYDNVYVAKGGTMNELLLNFTGTEKGGDGQLPVTDANGFTVKGLACPKYYFMAVLSEKGEEYHAVGFLVEHREGHPKNPSVAEMQAYVLSIDELEARTGLDFFCNLPDEIEKEVEAVYSLEDWSW